MLRAAFAAVILALAALPVAAVPVAELVAEKARDSFGPELPEDADFRITLQSAGISEAELISAFWMDRATGQFLANAVRADGGVTRLQGLAILTLEVPVPLRKMMPGEMLRESDLQMVELPYARLGSFALTDSARLIGKEVKRMLPRGRPWRNRWPNRWCSRGATRCRSYSTTVAWRCRRPAAPWAMPIAGRKFV